MIALTEGEIRPSEVVERVHKESDGALVLFLGTVRSPSGGRGVTHLFYEAYREMALERLTRIVGEAKSRWDPGGIAVIHRLGKVPVGEVSLLIAVSAVHRAEAYDASRFVLEEIKREVPIWKKEYGEDGERWIGSEPGGERREGEDR